MFSKLSAQIIKAFKVLKLSTARRALLFHGVAASAEHYQVLANLDCRSVIDIGANRGQFALIARALFPDARIFSFEPLPQLAPIFKKVFAKDNNIHLYSTAIGTEQTRIPMHISARDDSSSLLPIGEEQCRIFPGTEEIDVDDVAISPLHAQIDATQINRPALLKIDVQGYELKVLEGCAPLLSCFDTIYCECSFLPLYEGQALAHEVISWLQSRGFILQGVYNMSYDRSGKAVQADFLFYQQERM